MNRCPGDGANFYSLALGFSTTQWSSVCALDLKQAFMAEAFEKIIGLYKHRLSGLKSFLWIWLSDLCFPIHWESKIKMWPSQGHQIICSNTSISINKALLFQSTATLQYLRHTICDLLDKSPSVLLQSRMENIALLRKKLCCLSTQLSQCRSVCL